MFKPSDTALISDVSKVMLKILHARLQHFQTKNLQMSNLGLEKAAEPEIKLLDHRESKGILEKYLPLCNLLC